MPSASWSRRRSIAAWSTGAGDSAGELAARAKPARRLAANPAAANRHHRRHRARHVLQACELLHIPVPEKLCVIGIDNEELTRYLSRVALSSVARHPPDGLSGGKITHRLLNNEALLLQRQLIPPMRVVERRSTDYRSLNDPP